MKKILIITLILSVALANYRIIGNKRGLIQRRHHRELSVPNPNPPIGKRLDRAHCGRLPKSLVEVPETVKVCAVRVEFQPDSNPKSTGTGTFLLERDTTWRIDPPPHNKKYFESHLEALARYWYFISHGKLVVEYEVFPTVENSAYRLPDSMGYYSADGWFGENLADRLFGFFRDAWLLVDSLDSIQYDKYDIFIVFHAGSDWQNDVASMIDPVYVDMFPDVFVPSPWDLPTAFIVLDEPVVGPVDRGIVLPEFASQDGQLVALNGVITHEFGHALGLVDLYSTADFFPGVGYFSLMDNGHSIGVTLVDSAGNEFDVWGAIPAYISAWERAYMGWEDIVELSQPADSILISACEIFSSDITPTIYKIPIDEFEYFLIENREASLDTSPVILKQDSVTGVIQGVMRGDVFTGEYDYLLPGSGMLIWHIDERVAYGDYDGDGVNNFLSNQLQVDWLHKFIELMEADGIQDLGFWSTYLGEKGDIFGYPSATVFGPRTFPASNSYSGAKTGAEIYNISTHGNIMSFSFRYSGPRLLWRKTVGFPLQNPIVPAYLNSDTLVDLITSTNNFLLAWSGDGSYYMSEPEQIGLIIYDGDTAWFDFPLAFESDTFLSVPSAGQWSGIPFIAVGDWSGNLWLLDPTNRVGERMNVISPSPVQLGSAITRNPVCVDIDADGMDEILVGSAHGRFACISANGMRWSIELGGEFAGCLFLPDGKIVAIAQQAKGRVFIIDLWGNILHQWDVPTGQISAPVALVGLDTLIIFSSRNEDAYVINSAFPLIIGKNIENSRGIIYAYHIDGSLYNGFPILIDAEPSGPVISDFDGDGASEILVVSDSLLLCFKLNGTLAEDFPIRSRSNDFALPIILGMNGNNYAVFPDGNRDIYAYNQDLSTHPDFPLACGPSVVPPTWAGKSIILPTVDGVVYSYSNFNVDSVLWPFWGVNPGMNRVVYGGYEPVVCPDGKPIVLSFYNYPNPAGERTILRSSFSQEADFNISIYNEAGLKIAEFTGRSLAGFPTEVEWNTVGNSPGIYRAILEAKSDGKTETRKHIIAVIK